MSQQRIFVTWNAFYRARKAFRPSNCSRPLASVRQSLIFSTVTVSCKQLGVTLGGVAENKSNVFNRSKTLEEPRNPVERSRNRDFEPKESLWYYWLWIFLISNPPACREGVSLEEICKLMPRSEFKRVWILFGARISGQYSYQMESDAVKVWFIWLILIELIDCYVIEQHTMRYGCE